MKKLVYLYLVNHAKTLGSGLLAVNTFVRAPRTQSAREGVSYCDGLY